MKNIFKHKSILFSALLLIGLATSQVALTNQASATYRAGNLTDDSVFLNTNSMSLAQIQGFLTSMEGQIATKTFHMDCDLAGQQAKNIYLSINAPCGSTATSAQIIHYAARVYGINPQVIIATIQKEQSLITAKNPTQRQYGQVMGYACPTTGECDSNSNFLWQVDNGTWALRYHFERARGNNTWWNSGTWAGSGCAGETRYRKPSAYPQQNVAFYDEGGRHYTTVYIENAATSAFYCYTPHVYNNFPGCIPAWGVSYANWKSTAGSTGNCYSGSYNYVTAFESWFGSVHAGYIIKGSIKNKYDSIGGASKLGNPLNNEVSGGNGLYWQQFENGYIIGHFSTGYYVSKGSIRQKWIETGLQSGLLGIPVSDEKYNSQNNSWSQDYQNGIIITLSSGKEKYFISKPIYDTFLNFGNKYRIPISDAKSDKLGNSWQQFDNGYIFGNISNGFYESAGSIRQKWIETGLQSGLLGVPTGNIITTSKDCYQQTYSKGIIKGCSGKYTYTLTP